MLQSLVRAALQPSGGSLLLQTGLRCLSTAPVSRTALRAG